MRLLITTAFAALIFAGPAAAAQTAESKACSDQATAKGLHGADREKFRTDCMKASPAPMAAAPAAKPAAAAPAAKPVAPMAAAPAAKAGFAPKSDAAKACSDQATAKGLHGADREKFRTSCLKGAPAPMTAAPAAKPAAAPMAPAPMAAAPAKPAPAPMAAAPAKPAPMAAATKTTATTTTTASGKPRTPAQEAANARIKQCGQMWQADKAAGKVAAGQTWPKYWHECSDKLKAQGK